MIIIIQYQWRDFSRGTIEAQIIGYLYSEINKLHIRI